MKRYSFATGLALAVVTVVGLAGPAAAQQQVPFQGNYVGVDRGTPTLPPLASALVQATGNATQLGACTYTALVTVNTVTGAGVGTFVFTAANGDTVVGSLTGKATFSPPNLLSIAESAMITGGTGRFAGATGSFRIARVKNTVTGATAASFTGTISTVGRSN